MLRLTMFLIATLFVYLTKKKKMILYSAILRVPAIDYYYAGCTIVTECRDHIRFIGGAIFITLV